MTVKVNVWLSCHEQDVLMMKTAEKIALLRKKSGLTQKGLADALFVSRSLVSLWELGKRLPDWVSLAKMADLFECDENDLINNEEYAHVVLSDIGVIDDEIKEFSPCLDTELSVENWIIVLNSFLSKESKRNSDIFINRYYYRKTNKTIADEYHIKESTVRTLLTRLRRKLKKELSR